MGEAPGAGRFRVPTCDIGRYSYQRKVSNVSILTDSLESRIEASERRADLTVFAVLDNRLENRV